MHTPLIAWIANYPEQLLITCNSSEPPHDCEYKLQKIQQAAAACDPHNIVAFHKVCLALHLNGVMEPFWKDWGHTCPSHFLTPNALHQWHKFYFDHCVYWVINIIGGEELDHCLAALQPRIGTRHWVNGVSTLKQCTSQEHCKLEKLLPAVAAGVLPDDMLCTLCAITEFIFLAQGISHYDETIHSLSEALCEFHHYKSSILRAHGCLGKNSPLDHFQIPKVELTQHIAWSIHQMGAPYQWTSDITEHCHITHVKVPYHLSNC
ncbi:hypothetical protein F5J12DRAFT_907287 [Pisolithus orientalis]|uniref:uncharacterized protein n=1 Tax=Pisolithus orientalis TaxID=936130 RepID=UPI002225ADE0|nr:uncharacterized protein F5J12DRAFT_907287 [Pisolithus orientalis]KAI5994109.1 hypothetical protein F5J12DRAFT_907287 [Pisolithus orientalis]